MEINDVGLDGRAPHESAPRAGKVARSNQADPKVGAGEQQREPGSRKDVSSQMIEQLSDQASEIPPRNIHVLAASVQKFLLTNLEPALRIAKEIRDQATENSAHALEELANDDRREQALALLSTNN